MTSMLSKRRIQRIAITTLALLHQECDDAAQMQQVITELTRIIDLVIERNEAPQAQVYKLGK